MGAALFELGQQAAFRIVLILDADTFLTERFTEACFGPLADKLGQYSFLRWFAIVVRTPEHQALLGRVLQRHGMDATAIQLVTAA